jgi:hypothetical protein
MNCSIELYLRRRCTEVICILIGNEMISWLVSESFVCVQRRSIHNRITINTITYIHRMLKIASFELIFRRSLAYVWYAIRSSIDSTCIIIGWTLHMMQIDQIWYTAWITLSSFNQINNLLCFYDLPQVAVDFVFSFSQLTNRSEQPTYAYLFNDCGYGLLNSYAHEKY